MSYSAPPACTFSRLRLTPSKCRGGGGAWPYRSPLRRRPDTHRSSCSVPFSSFTSSSPSSSSTPLLGRRATARGKEGKEDNTPHHDASACRSLRVSATGHCPRPEVPDGTSAFGAWADCLADNPVRVHCSLEQRGYGQWALSLSRSSSVSQQPILPKRAYRSMASVIENVLTLSAETYQAHLKT